MRIDRKWAMPNRRTFSIRPIRELIDEEVVDGVWVDPFAGDSGIATFTNDLNPETRAQTHMDALEYLRTFPCDSVDGVLYDPPYSPRQVAECYKGVGVEVTNKLTQARFWGDQKKEIARIVKSGGKVLTFGWNSGGIGKKHGFELERVLLVPHGGWHNDTIVTVERKV